MEQLHHELLRHFEEEPDVTVASATFEIVGFAPLKSDLRMKHGMDRKSTEA